MNPLLFVLYFFEMTACITGFIFWDKTKKTFWRVFPIFLLYIVLRETIVQVFTINNNIHTINIFYNFLFTPVEFIFFYWLFYKNLEKTKFKQLPIACSFFYLTTFIIDLFSHHFVQQNYFQYFSYTIGNLFLLTLAVCFFYIFIKGDTILKFKYNMFFWVCIGLLVYRIGSVPYWSFFGVLSDMYVNLLSTLKNVMLFGNIGMYVFFTIGFLLGK